MTPARRLSLVLFASSVLAAACGGARQEPPPPPPPTAQEADQFIAQVNTDLMRLWAHESRTSWVKATYINHDTEQLEAQARDNGMEYLSRKIKEERRYE